MHTNPQTLKRNVLLTLHCSLLTLHTPASLALVLFLKHTKSFLPPDFACCCSLGLSLRSPALHATGPTTLQVIAQI